MAQISFKKMLIVFVIIFLLSRSGKILEFFSHLNTDGILTIEPLRESSIEARFLITLALCALAFITVFSLLNKRK